TVGVEHHSCIWSDRNYTCTEFQVIKDLNGLSLQSLTRRPFLENESQLAFIPLRSIPAEKLLFSFPLLRSHSATGAQPPTLRKASESSTPFRQCLCRLGAHPCPNVATKGETCISQTKTTKSERSALHHGHTRNEAR